MSASAPGRHSISPRPQPEMGQRKEVLRVLFDAGGKVVESLQLPMYGRAEAVVRRAARQDIEKAARQGVPRHQVWTTGRAAGIRQIETSPPPRWAGPIDLMQIHDLVDWRTHLPAPCAAGRSKKRIRYVGLTHYTVPALDELAAIAFSPPSSIDFLQFAYSIQRARSRKTRLCRSRPNAAWPSSSTGRSTAARFPAACAARRYPHGRPSSSAPAGASSFSSTSWPTPR